VDSGPVPSTGLRTPPSRFRSGIEAPFPSFDRTYLYNLLSSFVLS
jgi:hypothetical protein